MVQIHKRNMFSHIPARLSEERCETIFQEGQCKIERIISKGHASPPGFWYDQSWDEWVLLLKGRAVLAIEGQEDPIDLYEGDTLLLAARTRHRVEWTAPDIETIWLAVHVSRQEE
jgi:cupin 2 domain-containing protein